MCNFILQTGHKITYIIVNDPPPNLTEIHNNETQQSKQSKKISNAYKRHIYQLDKVKDGLTNAEPDDIIIVGDLDEIPNLEDINFDNIKNKLIFFKQKMFYYKLNLFYKKIPWFGSRACKKKYLNSPQWLRNIKDKKYPFFRLDIFFSKTKYIDIKFINDGGWHFSNIKTAAEIEYKLKSYLHHREFDENPMSKNEINEIIKNKQAIYDLKVDKRVNKIGNGSKLEKYPLDKLPEFLKNNLNKYKDWID